MLRKAVTMLLLSVVLFSPLRLSATREDPDTVHSLGEIEVQGRAPTQGVRRDSVGRIVLAPAGVMRGVRVMGEADAMRTLLMLPGFSSAGDYGAGVSIGGVGHSHTSYSVDGAPVFFPYHFGGMFSTYNTPHFARIVVDDHRQGFTGQPRLGGSVSAYTAENIPDALDVTANVGMIASSVSVHAPVAENTAVHASGRVSYINALYSGMLSFDDSHTRYGLCDAALAVTHRFADGGRLKISAMGNADNVRFFDASYDMDTRLRWHNLLAGLSYRRENERMVFEQTASASFFGSSLDTDVGNIEVRMPSAVSRFALGGRFETKSNGAKYGCEVEYMDYRPQNTEIRGVASTPVNARRLHSVGATAGAGRFFRIGSRSSVELGAEAQLWSSGGAVYGAFDPRAAWRTELRDFGISVSASSATQMLHQVGYSDIGNASDFFIPSGKGIKPQRAISLDASVSRSVLDSRLDLTVTLLGKRVMAETLYPGNLLSALAVDYDILDDIETVSGYNYGGSVMARYNLGAVSGWCSYSLVYSRRRYADNYTQWLPSPSEQLHAIKTVIDWQLTKRLQASALFTAASGRPYTPVKAIYIIAGNLLMEYGARNSARLPATHRLDVSVTYNFDAIKIGTRSIESYLNLSVMNCYGHRNIEMQYYVYDKTNNTVKLHRVPSLYRFMPSLSYTMRF